MSLRNQYRYIKSRYLKRIAGDLLFACDQIVNVVAKSYRDVSHDVSISLNDKKVTSKMGYFILSTILLVTILLLKIVIICHYFIKHWIKHWLKIKDILPYQ